jgi:hypothetical protein
MPERYLSTPTVSQNHNRLAHINLKGCMEISKDEAHSLFRKWKEESVQISLMINIGAARGSATGVVTQCESTHVVVTHLSGHFQILLAGGSFFYGDAREGPQSARDAFPNFVSGLYAAFKFGRVSFCRIHKSRRALI